MNVTVYLMIVQNKLLNKVLLVLKIVFNLFFSLFFISFDFRRWRYFKFAIYTYFLDRETYYGCFCIYCPFCIHWFVWCDNFYFFFWKRNCLSQLVQFFFLFEANFTIKQIWWNIFQTFLILLFRSLKDKVLLLHSILNSFDWIKYLRSSTFFFFYFVMFTFSVLAYFYIFCFYSIEIFHVLIWRDMVRSQRSHHFVCFHWGNPHTLTIFS